MSGDRVCGTLSIALREVKLFVCDRDRSAGDTHENGKRIREGEPMIRKAFIYFIAVSAALCPFGAYGATIRVPGDYPSIQAGIDGAVEDDIVLVAPGTYVENIEVLRKTLTLRSEVGAESTIIDGNQSGTVVNIIGGWYSMKNVYLEGFTIRNGVGIPDWWYGISYGGGISTGDFAMSWISNCIITENSADFGGGAWCIADWEYTSGDACFSNCIITGYLFSRMEFEKISQLIKVSLWSPVRVEPDPPCSL